MGMLQSSLDECLKDWSLQHGRLLSGLDTCHLPFCGEPLPEARHQDRVCRIMEALMKANADGDKGGVAAKDACGG